MPGYVSCVIAHPNDDTEARMTRDHCVACGFAAPPRIIQGIRLPPGGHFNAFGTAHTRCLRVMQRSTRAGHVLIMEDDCRFVPRAGGSVHARIEACIARVEGLTGGAWHSLHLGHVPLGPCVPMGRTTCGDGIIWSALPFTGHAYLINRRHVPALLRRWNSRPFHYEGMLCSPVWTRFAAQPAMATQIRRPKELRMIDEATRVTRTLDFSTLNDMMCALGLVCPLVLVLLVSRMVLCVVQ